MSATPDRRFGGMTAGCVVGHADQVGRPTAQVSVAAELRLFLKPAHRTGPVRVGCDGVSSLGHVVQSLGVPLTEVGRLAVNGRPVPPRYRPGDGDVVEVGALARPQLVPVHRFILDVHLGALARRLRLVGIDAAYANEASDDALIEQANAERRILLTQDRGLLHRRALWLGGYVYGAHPDDQFTDVLDPRMLAERWNGTSWHIQPMPTPPAAPDVDPPAVACPSPLACTAAGGYTNTGPHVTLAEQWNGTSNSARPAASRPAAPGSPPPACAGALLLNRPPAGERTLMSPWHRPQAETFATLTRTAWSTRLPWCRAG